MQLVDRRQEPSLVDGRPDVEIAQSLVELLRFERRRFVRASFAYELVLEERLRRDAVRRDCGVAVLPGAALRLRATDLLRRLCRVWI